MNFFYVLWPLLHKAFDFTEKRSFWISPSRVKIFRNTVVSVFIGKDPKQC